MNVETHWILERAKRVLDPDTYRMLEAALTRPVAVPQRNQSRQPDGSLNTRPGGLGEPSEAENREIWGK